MEIEKMFDEKVSRRGLIKSVGKFAAGQRE